MERGHRYIGRVAALAAGLLPGTAAAAIVCALGAATGTYKPAQDQRPSPDAVQLAGRVNTVLKKICGDQCPTIGLFRNPTAANLMLTLDRGTARLIYAPEFFAAVYGTYGDNGILALITHEIGHGLDDTMGAAWIRNTWTAELRADAWAGCALGRLDLPASGLGPALAALSKYPAPGHPAWNLRLPPLRTGYTQCGGDGAKFDAAARK